MSFKMMNGVEVYDKSEVDGIVESVNSTTSQHTSDITQLKTKTNSLETSKANTSQVQNLSNSLAADEQRLTGLENNINEHSQRITALESHSATTEAVNQQLTSKADKTYAQQTRQIADNNSSAISALADRATALENSKADRSEIPDMVNSVVDGMINAKVAVITSDINHIVDNAIDDTLEDYDDSDTVDDKISAAVPVAMSTAEAAAIVNQYF